MSERPSVDSEALRREARRRRILENSEKRLSSITGRPVSEPSEARQESRNRFPYDFQNPHVSDTFGEPGESSSPEMDAEEDFLADEFYADDGEEDSLIGKLAMQSNPRRRTWMKSLIHRRSHIIILSLIIQLLYILKLGYLFFNNVYCPFVVVKVVEIWLVNDPFRMDNQEQVVLMSAVFKGQTAKRMLKAYYIFAVIASDFCLYIFVIVASDKLFHVIISPFLPN